MLKQNLTSAFCKTILLSAALLAVGFAPAYANSEQQVKTTNTFKVLYHFSLQAPGGLGEVPKAALAYGTDGQLYGTTSENGAYGRGTIFKLSPEDASPHTLLHSFNGFDGASPQGRLLLDSDGAFYGTASAGGAHNAGVIFKLKPGKRLGMPPIYQLIYSFDGVNGAEPVAGLIDGKDGYFYGTTLRGGANDHGTIFRIKPPLNPGGIETLHPAQTLHSFKGQSGLDGASPQADLLFAKDGYFYGTTTRGGANDDGSIFRFKPVKDSSTVSYTPLHSFNRQDGGALPITPQLVYGKDGDLYGTTRGGGVEEQGVIFKFKPPAEGSTEVSYQVVHFFGGVSGGQRPTGGVVLAPDGYLYGATSGGGFNNTMGTLFKIDPEKDSSYTVLHPFSANYSEGRNPTGLILGRDNYIYGVAPYSALGGTIFRMSLN